MDELLNSRWPAAFSNTTSYLLSEDHSSLVYSNVFWLFVNIVLYLILNFGAARRNFLLVPYISFVFVFYLMYIYLVTLKMCASAFVSRLRFVVVSCRSSDPGPLIDFVYDIICLIFFSFLLGTGFPYFVLRGLSEVLTLIRENSTYLGMNPLFLTIEYLLSCYVKPHSVVWAFRIVSSLLQPRGNSPADHALLAFENFVVIQRDRLFGWRPVFVPRGDDFVPFFPGMTSISNVTKRGRKYREIPRGRSTFKDIRLRPISFQELKDSRKTFNTKLYEPAPLFRGSREKVYGRTWFSGKEYMFPVTCDVESFCSFVNEALRHHYEEAIQLFLFGILEAKLRPLYADVLKVPKQPNRRFEPMSPEFGITTNEGGDVFDKISLFCNVSLICQLAYKNDYTSLITFLGTKPVWTSNLVRVLNLNSINELIDWIKSCFSEPYAGEWVVLDSLPQHIRQSGIVLSVTKLISYLTLSSFTSEGSILGSIISKFDFSGVTEKTFSAILLTQVLYAIAKGLERLFIGDGFWGLTKDVSFSREANSILDLAGFSISHDVAEQQLVSIDRLLKSRENLKDSPEISRIKEKLIVRARELHSLIRNNSPRVPAIAIWLNGSPGTGKTTLVDSMISRFAEADSVPRKFGDTIFYNIHDVFPVESGALCDARYLVINDIRADYSSDTKNGLRPLDVVLQQILDTAPADLPQAFDKGTLFYNLRYLFITSNHVSYKFSSDAEKLIRRLEDGVLVNIEFNKKIGSYAESVALSQGTRNSSLNFELQRVKVDGSRMAFMAKGPVLKSYPAFFKYVEDKIARTQAKHAKDTELFRKNLCACGVARALHIGPVEDYIEIFPGKCDSEKYVPPEILVDSPDKASVRALRSDLINRLDPRPTVRERLDLGTTVDVTLLRSLRPTEPIRRHFDADDSLEEKEDVCLPQTSSDPMGWNFQPTDIIYYTLLTYLMFVAFERFREVLSSILVLFEKLRDTLREVASSSANEVIVALDRSPLVRRMFITDEKFDCVRDFNSVLRFYSKVKLFLRENRAYILAAVGIGSLGLYIHSQRKGVEPTGEIAKGNLIIPTRSVMRVGKVENPTRDAKKREWVRNEPYQSWELETIGVKDEDLEIKCKRAIKTFVIHAILDGKAISKNALGFVLNSNIVLINLHAFQDKEGKEFDVNIEHNGISSRIKPADRRRLQGSEIVAILNVWYKDYENLSKFLPIQKPTIGNWIEGKYIGPRGTESINSFTSTCTLFGVQYDSLANYTPIEKGDCMSPLLCKFGGSWFLGGFLMAMEGGFVRNKSHFSFVMQHNLDSLPEFFAPAGYIFERFPSELSPISSVSQWNHLRPNYLKPLGTDFSERGSSFHSRLKRTILYDDVSPKLSEPYGFPKTVGGMVNGVYKSSWTNTFNHFDLQDLSSSSLRFEAAKWYAEDCLKHSGGTSLQPLSVAEAFKGHVDMSVDKIKWGTSCGKTWRKLGFKKKTDLFEEIEENVFEIDTNFLESIDGIIERLKCGIASSVLIDLVHKDEVRPLSKLNDYKIRLFSVLDADVNIVYRMYFMPLISFLLANPFDTECFGQLNAASTQWTDLAKYLQQHGEHCIDMDFASFDTSHSSATFACVSYFFEIVADRLGYTEDECRVVRILVDMLNNQIMCYSADYFYKTKGMPSGVVLTLILNSIVNSIMSRMAFSELTRKHVSDYKIYVHTATVGDDNASNVADSIIDEFNTISIQPLYKTWGYIVTPAQKDRELVKSMPLSEITFVKRRFVRRSDGLYLAPLNVDSIYKAFCFEESDNKQVLERLRNVYQSAIREAFLHGEDFYQEFDGWIKGVFSNHGIECPVVDYKNIEEDFVGVGLITAWA